MTQPNPAHPQMIKQKKLSHRIDEGVGIPGAELRMCESQDAGQDDQQKIHSHVLQKRL